MTPLADAHKQNIRIRQQKTTKHPGTKHTLENSICPLKILTMECNNASSSDPIPRIMVFDGVDEESGYSTPTTYARPPLLSPPQVAPLDSPIVPDALGGGPKGIVITRADGDKGDDSGATLRGKRKLEVEMAKLSRQRGAIIAPSRTADGFKLTAGSQQSCMTDAIENGMKLDGYDESKISSARLRSDAIPELGNVLQATWASCVAALHKRGLPYKLVEVTARFQGGPPMLHLLCTTSGVFVVGLLVEIEGKKNAHCIAFSASLGTLIDNGPKTRPVYIEDKDRRGKKAARDAFRLLVGQKVPKGMQYSVDITDVYELKGL